LGLQTPGFKKNKLLWTGGGMFLLFVIVFFLKGFISGYFPSMSKLLNILPLFGILGGIGLAFFALFKEMGIKERFKSLERELQEHERNFKKKEAKLEIEVEKINRLMTSLGLRSPEELTEKVKLYQELKKEAKLQEEKVREIEGEMKNIALRSKEEVERELKEIREELQRIGPPVMSVSEIETELSQSSDIAEPVAQESPARIKVAGDPVDKLLSDMGDYAGEDKAFFLSRLQEFLQPSLQAVTDNRWEELFYEEDKLFLRSGDERVEVMRLSPSTRDLLFILVTLAFHRYLTETRPLPLLLDDVLITQDSKRRDALLEVMKEGGQVLITGSYPELLERGSVIRL